MEHIRLEEECIHCVIDKFARDYPKDTPYEQRIEFIKRVLGIIKDTPITSSAPEIVERINLLSVSMFGEQKDYSHIKEHFNNLILSMEEDIYNRICKSENPLLQAVRYSMTGNYIDFGAMDSVCEDKLHSMIDASPDIQIDKDEFGIFEKELSNAKAVVLLADNCGEIVFDKLLIRTIKRLYPHLKTDVIVRGLPVLNDITAEDAEAVGIDSFSEIYSNGTGVAGTIISRMPLDTKQIFESADVIISKGQGNFETLRYCGRNVYYIFMCKCRMFADRFGVEQFSPMFINDTRFDITKKI